MMKRASVITLLVCVSLAFFGANVFAGSPADLAKESEAKASATSTTTPTPEMIMQKVDAAVALLEAEGTSGFAKFKGKDSPYIFAGTYIWIHDGEGVMRMHPIKYKLEGKNLIGLKDANGKRFFAVMNKRAKGHGAGWVDYMWPKPGEKGPSQKVSYVKGVEVNGKLLVVGCGVYDLSSAEAAKLLK